MLNFISFFTSSLFWHRGLCLSSGRELEKIKASRILTQSVNIPRIAAYEQARSRCDSVTLEENNTQLFSYTLAPFHYALCGGNAAYRLWYLAKRAA